MDTPMNIKVTEKSDEKPTLPVLISRLEERLHGLSGALDDLEDKTSAVLKPSEPMEDAEGRAQDSGGSPLRMHVERLNNLTGALIRRVEETTNRLEL